MYGGAGKSQEGAAPRSKWDRNYPRKQEELPMWYRSFCGAVGRVTIGTFGLGTLAVLLVITWLALVPMLPAMVGYVRAFFG